MNAFHAESFQTIANRGIVCRGSLPKPYQELVSLIREPEIKKSFRNLLKQNLNEVIYYKNYVRLIELEINKLNLNKDLRERYISKVLPSNQRKLESSKESLDKKEKEIFSYLRESINTFENKFNQLIK